ncbi:MAG: Cytochrome c-type protein NrfH [Elusimicrobia bacterium]|nr:Cytochrome c-type protein NrfH [Elusimicrobiota bacterium]
MDRLKKFYFFFLFITSLFCGLGLFTFHYAEGLSYFSTDPKACVNCHIMQPQYNSWKRSSHHSVASCVECHLPHNFINKYIAKADNGYRHSKGFTFQDFHEPIMISPRNSQILQENCMRCHSPLVHGSALTFASDTQPVSCVHCHSGVGHGERTGVGRFEKFKLYEGEKG